jgi:hypothetical protein
MHLIHRRKDTFVPKAKKTLCTKSIEKLETEGSPLLEAFNFRCDLPLFFLSFLSLLFLHLENGAHNNFLFLNVCLLSSSIVFIC